jgi:hypothetical protein
MKRERVPFFVSRLLAWRPVRWATAVGDHDGREHTLHVFSADAPDQRKLLAEIDAHRSVLDEAAGGPIIVIFHSTRQTAERYKDFAKSFPRPLRQFPPAVAPAPDRCLDEQDERGPHRRAA